jgi:hypothetical protein
VKKWLTGALLVLILLCTLATSVLAKTIASARANTVFFYAINASGKSMLLKVPPLSDLKKLSHGQLDGNDYSIFTTVNYPPRSTTGRGASLWENCWTR